MRERLLWFVLGAVSASVCCAFAAWHRISLDDATSAATARTQADLARQLENLEVRLVAVSRRSEPPDSSRFPSAVSRLPPTASATTESGASAPTPAQRLAASASGRVVDHAVRAGYWSVKDADDFAQLSAGMRDDDRFELTRQLVQAINEDRVQVEEGAELR